MTVCIAFLPLSGLFLAQLRSVLAMCTPSGWNSEGCCSCADAAVWRRDFEVAGNIGALICGEG